MTKRTLNSFRWSSLTLQPCDLHFTTKQVAEVISEGTTFLCLSPHKIASCVVTSIEATVTYGYEMGRFMALYLFGSLS